LVMAELARIVEEGAAVIATLGCGTIELRLGTGEVFRLGETAVTRIA
jgi:alpha-D-ribose 1-methylphosphonate 5-triphosphate synthase subunit PhnG